LLFLALAAGVASRMPDARAQDYDRVYSIRTQRYEYRPPQRSLADKITDGVRDAWNAAPIKKGLMGAGIGLGAAALAERNLLRGSFVGAGIGAGVGLMDDSAYFNAHPLMKNLGKGALIGAGAASVTGIAGMIPAAAVGAGIGTGVHLLRTH
jgi:hypothetical protein